MTARILIIEDEDALLRMLKNALGQAGYEVQGASTAKAAVEQLIMNEFAAILLDLGLPDLDGKDVIPQALAVSNAPILVLSARASETEKILALDLGASDYVSKPFDMGELLARIRVALRGRQPRQVGGSFERQGLEIDFAARRALAGDKTVRLSKREAEMLQILALAKGEVVPREALSAQLWGEGADSDGMNIRVLAWQVRQKIEPDASAPRFLIAEAGEGYRLNLE